MAKNVKWGKNKAVKATQIAFELEKKVVRQIHQLALAEGLTTSSQIRKLINLPYSPPKRPRLTVSLSQEDYDFLGKRYNVDASDTLEIKRMIMRQLIEELGE
jgi:hypothetical protein